MTKNLQVGDTVRLIDKPELGTAKVQILYSGSLFKGTVFGAIPGGLRLDRHLAGFYSWNEEELEKVDE